MPGSLPPPDTRHVDTMDVGVIGLGRMGSAMARNLARSGHRVRAWNRSPLAAELPAGVEIVPSPAEALQADAAFTMLSDDSAIRDVLLSQDALHNARPGLVHVVSSTISVGFADELRARHAEAGVGYVSAPVFGRPEAAEAAQLEVMAAGDKGAVEKVHPLLDVIGRRTWVLGADPKQANAAKIAGNMMMALAIEAIAEAMALTGGSGVAPQDFADLMVGTLFGCPAYRLYTAKIIGGDYEAGFTMSLGLKDLGLAAAAAEHTGHALPLLDAVRARMADAVESGMADKDWSAVADYTLRR
jgi:3-hydroxyisobutyrate dehydrogenase-like beta-hydroxyacid dehydrogenase